MFCFNTKTSLIFNLYLFCLSKAGTDRDQEIYLEKINIKCGTLPYINPSTPRIINGKPSKQLYPWVALIINKIAVDPKYSSKTNLKHGIFVPIGGAIISETTIITCGHCICKYNEADGVDNDFFRKTCLKNEKQHQGEEGAEANQNQRNINEVYIELGTSKINRDMYLYEKRYTYDPEIKAILYHYDPPDSYDETFHTFSNQGDIGLIIKKKGLGLLQGKVVPICLPTPDVYNNKNGFHVAIVGWGSRYEEKEKHSQPPPKKPKLEVLSSCETNEGRMIHGAHSGRSVFLPCKIREDGKYCWKLFEDKKFPSFPIDTELKFTGKNIEEKTMSVSKILLREYARCSKYYEDTKKLWVDFWKTNAWKGIVDPDVLSALFDEDIDRIQVKTTNDKKEVIETETCYNTKALGEYGICETNEAPPFHWGFCSRSCDKTPTQEKENPEGTVEPYEAAIFEYFDTAPEKTLFADKMPSELQSVYKCIKPVLPRAVTGIFSKTKLGNLKFEGNSQDDERPSKETGHVRTSYGDSGSPYWIPADLFEPIGKSKSQITDYKATLVAIHSSRVGHKKDFPRYSEDEMEKCRMKATKLTDDIIKWAKEKSGISK